MTCERTHRGRTDDATSWESQRARRLTTPTAQDRTESADSSLITAAARLQRRHGNRAVRALHERGGLGAAVTVSDPDGTGTRVLDAGCGAGHLTAELADGGATVVGLDASREMLTYARERAPEADFVRADLGRELPFVESAFGGVVSSLAFHYVRDWEVLFRDLRRIPAPGGWVVFSVQHPHADFEEYESAQNYHEVERVSATWDSLGEEVEVPAYRRPLSAMLGPALDAGFRLDRSLEPTPTEAYRQADPERYEYEATRPNFLCLRLVAPT